jgi:hypothetical protein
MIHAGQYGKEPMMQYLLLLFSVGKRPKTSASAWSLLSENYINYRDY